MATPSAMAAIKPRRLNMYPPEINGGDFLHSQQLWSILQMNTEDRLMASWPEAMSNGHRL
jgi:hypothetical protein